MMAQTVQETPHLNREQRLSETPYTLGAGDRFAVTIYQVSEFSGNYLVLVDGTVSFPLIGVIKVEGMTLEQLSTLLTQKYAAFIKRPVLTTSLVEPRPIRLTIAGEVNRPGAYSLPLTQGKYPTLTDLIQLAGGITVAADIQKVTVKRTIGETEQLLEIDLWDLLQSANQSQNITLRDRDAIVIPTATIVDPATLRQLSDASFGISADQELNVAIIGEVYRPGSYKLSPARSDNDEQTKKQLPRISNAIQAAGGIKPLANVREVEVRRSPRNGSEQVFKVNLYALLTEGNLEQDMILQNGDIITIPQATELAPNESETLAAASFAPEAISINVVGEVKNPGLQKLRPNTPLNQAILAAGGFDQRRANQETVELVRLNENGTVTKRQIKVNLNQDISSENNPTLRHNDVIIVNRSGLTSTTDTLSTVLSPLGIITGVFSFFNIFGW